jgi:hypothetical protein
MSSSDKKVYLVLRGVVASALLLAADASADPAFPKSLQQHWNVPCTPSCGVCHFDASGGPAKIRKTTNGKPGFGAKLLSYGLDVGDLSSINAALDADKSDQSDVDGDGKSDFDELSVGDDPNDPTPGASVCSGPEFGCVRVARQGPVDGVASVSAAAVLLLGLTALRRRRRR